jgi:hypothetical protein
MKFVMKPKMAERGVMKQSNKIDKLEREIVVHEKSISFPGIR